MGGLLYKDFISTCRTKRYNIAWILVIFTIGFIILRMLFPGTAENMNMGFSEQGEVMGTVTDVMFMTVYGLLIVSCMSIINRFSSSIVENDEKNKITNYIKALPLEKNAYIASKYIFIGIACYVVLSIEYIMGMVCVEFSMPSVIADFCQILMSSIAVFAGIVLFLASIELPLFIRFGKEKAMMVKVAILLTIALVVIGYVLFCDLSIFDNYDIEGILNWITAHQNILMLVQVLSPVISIVIYYLSYRITCKLMAGEEQ